MLFTNKVIENNKEETLSESSLSDFETFIKDLNDAAGKAANEAVSTTDNAN